jgi:hypothetical protein
MAAVAGLRGTGDWGTDERPKNFREGILFAQPNGTSPIFALTSKAKKGKATTDPEFSWWNETNTLINLQINGALSASDTTFVVDSSDPSASDMSLNFGNATHLKHGDLLLVVPATDSATYNHEIVRVEAVASATTFTVTRGVAGTTAATIADDLYLTVIGSAYAEGTGAPEAVSKNPIKFSNYTQIFKDSYEITGTADETDARTGSAWSNDKKRKSFKHAMDIEMAFLFGQRAETTGANGKPLRYMGGIRTFLPSSNQYVYSTAVTGYQRSMFVLDMDAIRYVPMRGRDTKTMDDVQNKDEDVRRGLIQTECSLAVDYGGMTSCYLGGITV